MPSFAVSDAVEKGKVVASEVVSILRESESLSVKRGSVDLKPSSISSVACFAIIRSDERRELTSFVTDVNSSRVFAGIVK